jgi:isopentenyl diphosphate isomerase/L-lactate dehydrogenase-like FMN-dependent dehydrogenase
MSSVLHNAVKKSLNEKTKWQKFITSTLNVIRPFAKTMHPTLMKVLDYQSMKRVDKALNIQDLKVAAEKRAHPMVYAYLDGGCDDERALKRSVESFSDIQWKHAVLHGIGNDGVDTKTTILGAEYSMPYFLTSCAGQRMFHADGEIATARAAKKHDIHMALSQLTTSSFEDVRNEHDGAKTLQLYVWKDKKLLKDVLDRAKEAGFKNLALTADFSWVGNRERELRNDFTIPPSYSLQQCIGALKRQPWAFDFISREPYRYQAIPNSTFPAESLAKFISEQMKPEFNWEDAEWLCKEWGSQGKVVLKGVIREDDAERALKSGFHALWVSNHGGRQLEDSISPILQLQKIRNTVGPDVEIIVDGGVRRGSDVVKALALGANSVAIGRAYLYGLAAGGFHGVDKALQIINREVKLTMGLMGYSSIDKINAKNLILSNMNK